MTNSRLSALTTLLSHEWPSIVVGPWRDPVVERVGHDACGDYVELFWLSTVGPSATWLLRRLAVVVVTRPEGVAIHLADLARGIGLGSGTGPQSSVGRSLARLVLFGLARVTGPRLVVRAVVPPLPYKQLARLPEHLQAAHTAWCAHDSRRALALGYTGEPEPTTSSVW